MIRWALGRRGVADAALAAVVGILAVLGAWRTTSWQLPPTRPADTVGYALDVVGAIALLARRRWPLGVLTVATAAAAGSLLMSYPLGPPFLAMGIAMCLVAAQTPWRRSVAICLVACMIVFAAAIIGADGRLLPGVAVMLAGGAGWLMLPCAVGILLRIGRDDLAQVQEEEARRRAYEERLRIARKIHDVTGEWLAAINMQSAAALYVADKRPSQMRETLMTIKRDSKTALEELRATLMMLSEDLERAALRRPMPGLDTVDALVATTNDSGLRVQVLLQGTRRGLSAAIDLAAYRIIQQSLADVLRHTSSTAATVRIDYLDDGVQVEITDDRNPPTDVDCPTVAGIRQRANAVGGTLTAGPGPGGVYQIHAELPLGNAP
jgi:signal transduction histidine kinase